MLSLGALAAWWAFAVAVAAAQDAPIAVQGDPRAEPQPIQNVPGKGNAAPIPRGGGAPPVQPQDPLPIYEADQRLADAYPQVPPPVAPQAIPVVQLQDRPPPPVVGVVPQPGVPVQIVDGAENNVGPVNLFDLPPEQYAEANKVEHLMHDPFDGAAAVAAAGDEEEVDDEFVEAWAEHMDDFQPDMLVTFKLPSRSEEFFYQEVGPEATLIRGGYFVAEEKGASPVRFDVVDPDGQPVLKRLRTESLFHFVTEKAGIYTFTLSNGNWHHDTFVTLVLGAGNETSLRQDQLQSASENVNAITRMVRDIHGESNYLWARQKTHMQQVSRAGSRMLWLAGFELCTVVAAVFAQVYLMKGFVSSRRILF